MCLGGYHFCVRTQYPEGRRERLPIGAEVVLESDQYLDPGLLALYANYSLLDSIGVESACPSTYSTSSAKRWSATQVNPPGHHLVVLPQPRLEVERKGDRAGFGTRGRTRFAHLGLRLLPRRRKTSAGPIAAHDA